MSGESFHALVFFWIAFYRDGTYLPKYDLETGKGNDFKDIDQNKLDRFGLFPFNVPLAEKINASAGFIVVRAIETLPYFIMKIRDNQRLIYAQRNYIDTFSYQHCNKCGYEWQWMVTHKDGEETDIGFLTHPNYVLQEWENKKYPLAQCPKCGEFNAVVCTKCGSLIAEMKTKEPDDGNHIFKCRKCNIEFPRYIRMLEGTKRRLNYLLGYQTTVEGKNIKHILFIGENGVIEMSENYNYK